MRPKTQWLLRVWNARSMLAVLAISAVTGLLFVSPARAQTPADAQATPGGGEAVLRLKVSDPPEPIAADSEFQVQVSAENVQHLSAFEVSIDYDPALMTFERVEDLGKLLATGPRGTQMNCPDPDNETGAVHLACTTLGAPLCLGGLAGATGDGLLATVIFKSKGGGTTNLDLRDTTLLLDDLSPCDPDTGSTLDIPHSAESTAVELAKDSDGGDGNSTLLITFAAVIAAVIVVGGVAGLAWRRRRSAAP